ncbi:MAG: DUF2950 domain-containing protein [Planctomycetota bacterium]|nr:DUF2950 domain-containing protein [Planctomycetota bacterium]
MKAVKSAEKMTAAAHATHMPRHWQFSLRELLLWVFACALGLTVLLPATLARSWRADPPPDLQRAMLPCALLFLLASCCGLAVGSIFRLRFASECKRLAVMCVSLALAWAMVLPMLAVLNHSNLRENEAAAIRACKTYAEAQDIYRRSDWDSDGVLEFAQEVFPASGPALYEPVPPGWSVDLVLVSRAFAYASLPRADPRRSPLDGYFFKVLTGQGKNAPGGRKSYLTQGPDGQWNMTIGYGLLAWPAEYGVTGVNTFQINNTGTIYQWDYGPDTSAVAEALTEYEPPLMSSAE